MHINTQQNVQVHTVLFSQTLFVLCKVCLNDKEPGYLLLLTYLLLVDAKFGLQKKKLY